MSDREQLAELIRKTRWHRNGGQSDGYIADAIIAAGWRLVPEGSIVVSREDLDTARDAMGYLVDGWQWKKWNYGPAYDRIIAALGDADA